MAKTLGILAVTLGLLAGASALACEDPSIYDLASRDGLLRVNVVQHAAPVTDYGPGDMAEYIRQWSYRPNSDSTTWNDSYAWARDPAVYGRANMERYIGQWSYQPASASHNSPDGYAWARDPVGYGTDIGRFIRQWSYVPRTSTTTWTDEYAWARGAMLSVQACAAPAVDGVADR